ncbi:MAG: ATP-binding protein [Chloroflexi bacterium RBG_16_56_8]|nr:MAG: ATP-binding protein [Chloroflexi bacterium RBG_16_56_8]
MEKVLFSWSGGKDSAMALHEMLANKQYQVDALLTTVTEDYDRISMHGVRRILLERQAEALGIPLEIVLISRQASNEEYETQMEQTLTKYKELGVASVAFGDIFLEDLREYREKNLARLEMIGVFPIWKRDTGELMRSFIELHFKAVTVCVDTQKLDRRFAGRTIDGKFMDDFPKTAEVGGENGEYHSFVYDGPIFKHAVSHTLGEKVLRENRFYYCDLIPA